MTPKFADLADLPEDDRIAIIGKHAEAHTVAVPIDDDEAKVARYIEKVTTRYKVRHVETAPGIVPGTVTIGFAPLGH